MYSFLFALLLIINKTGLLKHAIQSENDNVCNVLTLANCKRSKVLLFVAQSYDGVTENNYMFYAKVEGDLGKMLTQC